MKVYRGKDGDTKPVEMECRVFGFPYKTTCGEAMCWNTHFKTEAEAWRSINQSAAVGVKWANEDLLAVAQDLKEAKEWAANAAAAFAQAKKNYKKWLSKERALTK